MPKIVSVHAESRDGKATPTVTGILLAGKQSAIERVMPTSQATFQVFEDTEVRVNQDLSGPLLRTIEKMREMLEPWNPEREFENGLFRQSAPEFDRRAFREALVNASDNIGTTRLSAGCACSWATRA